MKEKKRVLKKMKEIKYNLETKERIDKFLTLELNISRSKVLELIKDWKIKINNNWVDKPGQLISNGDKISILENDKPKEIKSIKMNLDILYEDENYLIVNKPNGLLVHPTSFKEEYTLASGIKHYFVNKGIFFEADDYRWGICHRLDKDTSGLILVAKNLKVQNVLTNLIKNKKILREYIALVNGSIETKKMKIDVPMKRNIKGRLKMITSTEHDAKDAVTYLESIKRYNNFSLIKCTLESGRTHQIRVHLKFIKNPIINDPLYGNNKIYNKYGQFLYSSKIEFYDPFKEEQRLVELKIPEEFKKFIEENK